MDNVLVICAHADDEVLGTGGVIQRHVAAGDDVHVVIVTNRSPSSLGLEEKIHATEAKRVLGYEHLYFLNFNDMDLDYNIIRIIEPLEKIYHEVSPTVVYTHHVGDNNQDHRAVFEASMIICRPQHRPPREFYSYEVPSSTEQSVQNSKYIFTPNHYVRLGAAEIKKKARALNKYTHQVRRYPKSSRCSKGLDVLARYRGLQGVAEFAEAFIILRSIR